MKAITRKSGVLLHITSLPDDIGFGRFSDAAYDFVDWLEAGGFRCWQTLPFTDCLLSISPYSAISSFAINPYFLDLKEFLTDDEIASFDFQKNNDIVVEHEKFDKALNLVFENCYRNYDISKFEKDNKYWLEDYACFKVIKKMYGNMSWDQFPVGLRNRVKTTMDNFKLKNKKEITKIKFIQFLLNKQWLKIKKYANDRGIEVFGDLPYYVEFDSADVWANPKNWQIENGKATAVAGVPPDYFNENGQLWGCPIYNYTNMAKTKYEFWQNRFKRLSDIFDIVRIDHFIAFSKFWSVPAGSKTAKDGKWVKGYGNSILKTIVSKSKVKIVAEDLGSNISDAVALKEKFGIPGLKVLQFAFDVDGDNVYQPHNYEKNCVAYIGTHDNNTFMGLLNQGHWDMINRCKRYLGMPLEKGNEEVIDNSILALYRSSANMVILTAQDILKLDDNARMNTPGTIEGNWTWQLSSNLDKNLCDKYKQLSELYAR